MQQEFSGEESASRAALRGEFWGVVAYYNPLNQDVLQKNFSEFSDGVRSQGLKLLVVELALGDAQFQIARTQCDGLIQRRTSTLLWHKERLLNLGIDHLPPTCDKLVWLDSDILFENPHWVAETAAELELHPVVQPFAQAAWLPEGARELPTDLPFGLAESHFMPGMAATMQSCTNPRRALLDYFLHGHCGFAWAARRHILARHGLYDRHVLGGGDVTIAHALYGDEDYLRGRNPGARGMGASELNAIAQWSRGLHAEVMGNLGFTPGRVLHLWHGATSNRNYRGRWKMLAENQFDPSVDVTVDEQGCLAWSTDKPQLHQQVSDYFHARVQAPVPAPASITD
ncbi:hypothetical protein [Ottowia thiooxydans]|uniref:hypothetical protein n=1 Tax=Ottowia thiooxydans TaxID=219182 RepID=UPI000491318A|nr:hypothetical protein [Ottowia thiooxydans]